MYKIIAALIVLNLAIVGGIFGCSQQEQQIENSIPSFAEVHDWYKTEEPNGAVRIVKEIEEREAKAREEAEAARAAEEAALAEEYYEEPYFYEEYHGTSGGDGFMQAGVRDGVDSDTETWYSSNSAYHYRTSEWTTDDEGYYRTDDGYYVVASNDYAEGTVINTSKGEAKVLDSGTDSGNVDFYVSW